MSLGARLTRHAQANILHGLLTAAASIAVSAILFRTLGTGYGVFALVWTTVTRFDIFDDSLGSYIVSRVAELRRSGAVRDHSDAADDSRHPSLGRAYHLYLVLALAGGAVAAMALKFLIDEPTDGTLAILGGLGLALAMASTAMARTLEGFENYVALRVLQSTTSLARLAVVVLLVRGGLSTPTPVVTAFVGVHGALFMGLTLLVSRRVPLKGLLAASPEDRFRPIVAFMRPLIAAKASAILAYRLDLWVLQFAVGPEAVAIYAVGDAVASLVAQLIEVFKAILPVSVRGWRNDAAWIIRFVKLTGKASGAVISIAAGALIAAADPLIMLWFGAGTPSEAVLVSQLLLFFYGSTAFRSSLQTVLVGQGRFGALERHFVRAGLGNIALSIVMAYVVGPTGPALGTVAAGLYLLVANTRSAEAVLGLPTGFYMRAVTARGAISVAVGTAVGLLMPLQPLDLWLEAIARGATASVLASLGYWLWVFEPSERNAMHQALKPRLAK